MKPIRSLQIAVATLVGAGVVAIPFGLPDDPSCRPAHRVAIVSSSALQTTNRVDVERRAKARMMQELARADVEAHHALERQLRRLDGFFETARTGVPGFVEHVFGLERQFALIRDGLPWSSGQHHARNLQHAFQARVLDPRGLDRLVRRIAADAIDAFQEIDDALLVRLRRDLDLRPTTRPLIPADRDRLIAAVKASLEATVAQTRPQVAQSVAAELGSMITSELVTYAVMRGAAASGLRGAAILMAPLSLGVSLVAYVAVDQAVGWAVDQLADPRGRLIRRIDAELILRSNLPSSTDISEASERICGGGVASQALRKRSSRR